MTLARFPDPFVHHERRRCRGCGDHVEVILLGGASCPRDPRYACSNCHTSPEATTARLALLEPPAQLDIDEVSSRPGPSRETRTWG